MPEGVYTLIAAVIFLLPLIAVFVRLGRLLQIVDNHTKEIEDLKGQHNSFENKASESLNSITASLHSVEISLARLSQKLEDSK